LAINQQSILNETAGGDISQKSVLIVPPERLRPPKSKEVAPVVFSTTKHRSISPHHDHLTVREGKIPTDHAMETLLLEGLTVANSILLRCNPTNGSLFLPLLNLGADPEAATGI
jgi:hypothetical protein